MIKVVVRECRTKTYLVDTEDITEAKYAIQDGEVNPEETNLYSFNFLSAKEVK